RPERHLDLAAAGGKVHVVDLLLEWNEQAVEDLLRRNALPPEVVNQQDPTVGLHLQRRAVGAAAVLPGGVEHLDLELSAHLYQRPRHPAPPPVGGLIGLEAMKRG